MHPQGRNLSYCTHFPYFPFHTLPGLLLVLLYLLNDYSLFPLLQVPQLTLCLYSQTNVIPPVAKILRQVSAAAHTSSRGVLLASVLIWQNRGEAATSLGGWGDSTLLPFLECTEVPWLLQEAATQAATLTPKWANCRLQVAAHSH